MAAMLGVRSWLTCWGEVMAAMLGVGSWPPCWVWGHGGHVGVMATMLSGVMAAMLGWGHGCHVGCEVMVDMLG